MRPVLRRVLSVAGKLIGLRRPVIGGAIERIAEGKPVIPAPHVQQKEPVTSSWDVWTILADFFRWLFSSNEGR